MSARISEIFYHPIRIEIIKQLGLRLKIEQREEISNGPFINNKGIKYPNDQGGLRGL